MSFQRGGGYRPQFGRGGLLGSPFGSPGGMRGGGARFGLAPLIRPMAHGGFRGGRGGGPRGPRPNMNKNVDSRPPQRPSNNTPVKPGEKKEQNDANKDKAPTPVKVEVKEEPKDEIKPTVKQEPVTIKEEKTEENAKSMQANVKKEEPPADVKLDRLNGELHLVVEPDGFTASNMLGEGFQYMWGGIRATHGVKKGKVCFEVQLLQKLMVHCPDEKTPHVARIGWSVDNSDFQLGEDKLSWGYGGTGKSSVDSKFLDYGKRYSAGDVVTCYIDLDARPKAIFYTLNGEYLGVAFRFGDDLGEKAVFPHVTCKNMKFRVNFGKIKPRHPLTNGFTMLQDVPTENLIKPLPSPTMPQEGQIIMMVGLPACGKSYWCEKYVKEHREKKFYILGTNNIIDRMKVSGLTRKRNYAGRWEELIKRASVVLNKLFQVTKKNPRNYILDQTNVYFTARRRKMEAFAGYKRTAAVIVNTPEVLKKRTDMQQKVEGKMVPEAAVMEMKFNFTLPEKGPSFDDVWYLEEKLPKAQELVAEYKREAQEYKKQKRSSGPNNSTNSPVPEKKAKFETKPKFEPKPKVEPKQNFEPKPISRGFDKSFTKSDDVSKNAKPDNTPQKNETTNRPEKTPNEKQNTNLTGSRMGSTPNSAAKDDRRPGDSIRQESDIRKPYGDNRRSESDTRKSDIDTRRGSDLRSADRRSGPDNRRDESFSRRPDENSRHIDGDRSRESRGQNEIQDRSRLNDRSQKDERGRDDRANQRFSQEENFRRDPVRNNVDTTGGTYSGRGRGSPMRGGSTPRNPSRPGDRNEDTTPRRENNLRGPPLRDQDELRPAPRDYPGSGARGGDDFRSPYNRGRDDFRSPAFREREDLRDLREADRYREARPSYGQPDSYRDSPRGLERESRMPPGRGDISSTPPQRGRDPYDSPLTSGRDDYRDPPGRNPPGRDPSGRDLSGRDPLRGVGRGGSSVRERDIDRDRNEFPRSNPSYEPLPPTRHDGAGYPESRFGERQEPRDRFPQDDLQRKRDDRDFEGRRSLDNRRPPPPSASQRFDDRVSRSEERPRSLGGRDNYNSPRPLMESYDQRDLQKEGPSSFKGRDSAYANEQRQNERFPARDNRYEQSSKGSFPEGRRPFYQDTQEDVRTPGKGILKSHDYPMGQQETTPGSTDRNDRAYGIEPRRGPDTEESSRSGYRQREGPYTQTPQTSRAPDIYGRQYPRENPRENLHEKQNPKYVDPSEYTTRGPYDRVNSQKAPAAAEKYRDPLPLSAKSSYPPPASRAPYSANNNNLQDNTPQRQGHAPPQRQDYGRDAPYQQPYYDSQQPSSAARPDERPGFNSKDPNPYSVTSTMSSRGYSYSSSSNKANDRVASSSNQPQMTTSTANYNPTSYQSGVGASSYGDTSGQKDYNYPTQSGNNTATTSSYSTSSYYGQNAGTGQTYQNQAPPVGQSYSNQPPASNQPYQNQSSRDQSYQSQQVENKSFQGQQALGNQSYQGTQSAGAQPYSGRQPSGNQAYPNQQPVGGQGYQSQQPTGNIYPPQSASANQSYSNQQLGNQSYQSQQSGGPQSYQAQQPTNQTYPNQTGGNQTYQSQAPNNTQYSSQQSTGNYPGQNTNQAYQQQTGNQPYQTQQATTNQNYQSQLPSSQPPAYNQQYQSQQPSSNQTYGAQPTAAPTYQAQPAANQGYQTQPPTQGYQTQQPYQQTGQQVPSYPPPAPTPANDPSQTYQKQQEDYEKAYSEWYANYAHAFAQLTQQQPAQPK